MDDMTMQDDSNLSPQEQQIADMAQRLLDKGTPVDEVRALVKRQMASISGRLARKNQRLNQNERDRAEAASADASGGFGSRFGGELAKRFATLRIQLLDLPHVTVLAQDRLRAAGLALAVPGVLWLIVKVWVFFFMFAMVKAIVPRYRYDQLMRLGWKVFLPLSLFWVVLTAGVLIAGPAAAHGDPERNRRLAALEPGALDPLIASDNDSRRGV